MSSYESFYDGLETDAMRRRFSRKRNFFFCLQLHEALLVLALLFCLFTWILGFKVLASHHLSARKFGILLLINVIVLLVYLLHAYNSNRKNDSAVGPDLCDQFCTTVFGECKQMVVSTEPEILSEKVSFRNKQIVVCENAEYSPIEEKHRVRELAVAANDCAAVKLQEEEVKHYMRTRSEPSAREKKSRRLPLRRWEKENRRQLAVADCYSAATKSMDHLNSYWMDHLNSEEFRQTIDSAIDARHKIWENENRVDDHQLLLI